MLGLLRYTAGTDAHAQTLKVQTIILLLETHELGGERERYQHTLCRVSSAGIGRTGTFIVIDILIDIIREKGEFPRPLLHS